MNENAVANKVKEAKPYAKDAKLVKPPVPKPSSSSIVNGTQEWMSKNLDVAFFRRCRCYHQQLITKIAPPLKKTPTAVQVVCR